MKKILSIALVLCMMLSICVVSVGAADGNTADFVLGDAVVDAGTATVTVELNVTNNPGFGIGAIYFDYDTSAMTMTDMALVSGTGFTLSKTFGADTNAGVDCDAYVVFDGADDWYGTGLFLTLTFALNEDVTGTFPVTAYIDDEANPLCGINAEDFVVPCTMDGEGTITIKPTNPIKTYNVALGENFALNFPYKATANDEITVTNAAGEPVYYEVANGVITIPNIVAKDLDETFTVTVNGWETTASVIDYCEYTKENSDDPELLALVEAMAVYNAAANNYFEDAGHELTVESCEVGTDNPRVVENAATGATFYSVRLQLDDGVKVLARMKNYTGEAITVTIDGVASAYEVKDVEGMQTVFVPVKAHQYDADIVITVGDSTLTYSVNTYIQQKQNSSDADLANLVNALGLYGQAAEAYAAKQAA